MKRRYLLFAAPLLPLSLLLPRILQGRPRRSLSPDEARAQAVRLDQLAANVHTPEDARSLIEFVTEIFSDRVPSAWKTRSLRARAAKVEYLAVTDPSAGIAEQRIADTWNTYATTIGAPTACHASAAEIHNLRDAYLSTARFYGRRGPQTLWSVSSIYSIGPDGSLHSTCRAVESFRILWDLANMPGNLEAARERVQQGTLLSEWFRNAAPQESSMKSYVSGGVRHKEPIEEARQAFVEAHGRSAYRSAVTAMLQTLLEA